MNTTRKPDLGPWIVQRSQAAFAVALALTILLILATGWAL